MVERKFKKWQLAFILGLIFIIPIILVFQFTNADIVIPINPDMESTERHCIFKDTDFGGGGTVDQTVCTYVLSFQSSPFLPVENFGITFTENENNWTLQGQCIDTRGENLARDIDVQERDCDCKILLDVSPNFKPNECIDTVIFDKDNWDRQLLLNEIIEQNTFTLKGG